MIHATPAWCRVVRVFAARLDRPTGNLFQLLATFDVPQAVEIEKQLRAVLVTAFGRRGRSVALPLVDLGDGRHLMRYVSRTQPPVLDVAGRKMFVEPPPGSVVRVDADFRPMRSSVGLMPVMRGIVVFEMAEDA